MLLETQILISGQFVVYFDQNDTWQQFVIWYTLWGETCIPEEIHMGPHRKYPLKLVILQNQSFPYNFPHCGLRYLQLSTGCPHRFPGAASASFTHTVTCLFGNSWPTRPTLFLMIDASPVTKLFVPPSDRRVRRTTTSKLPSEGALIHHKTLI